MKFGYIKTALCSPKIKVADVEFNTSAIIDSIERAEKQGAELIVFPQLSLTASTCFNLFNSGVLLDGALKGLEQICKKSENVNALIFVGAPIKHNNKVYNTAVGICGGKILGVVPQTYSFEGFEFAKCPSENVEISILGYSVPFGNKIIFKKADNQLFSVACEVGEDILSPFSPSTSHALAGALVVVNLSAFCETVGGEEFRLETVKVLSERLVCGYALCNAGYGESTTDCVYGGQKIIAEKGKIILDDKIFNKDMIVSEIDAGFMSNERANVFKKMPIINGYQTVEFNFKEIDQDITRVYEKTPFAPQNQSLEQRAEKILELQAQGLKKRLEHTRSSTAVIGLSGGLDSTLAILVAVKAIKELKRPLKDIIAITMPCFGTTSRTYQNTIKLGKALGVTLKKIDISKATTRHLKDIKHPEGVFDTTFENAQARERTQVLMDVANMNNGLVVGTGDLSELALGWATYNGDHMSMFAVNCSVPKTLVRHIVESCANKSKGKLKAVLFDILDTPVSPELLPAENDNIAQKTEDIVGPYILHDFFLYNMLRKGYEPKKLYYIACKTFKGDFSEQTILKWLKIFTRRFFNQQFKRSCLPDGVKVGTVALSPRGEFKMPSDACSDLWLKQLEEI